ncbi:MAG TPA: single-stranded DNA-binding protein [Actinomycetes bacterium]|nr:single-stranded DNA-binding protein [Actinomycetes bacterium]
MSATTPAHLNEVHLVGRLSAPPVERELPSGDHVALFRVVVERPVGAAGAPVDTLDCAAWRAGLRRAVSRWNAGDVVSVDGQLRRRFFRRAQGLGSRYEVEVSRARRLSRPT